MISTHSSDGSVAPAQPRASNGTNLADPSLFESVEVIGKGSFGLIRKVRRKADGKIFARKEIIFDQVRESDKRQIVAEVNILRKLRHRNIVQYEDRFVDSSRGTLYIVMEYCGGGDLGQVIRRLKRENTRLPEDNVWSYIAQMTSALHACHTRQGHLDADGRSSSLPSSSSLTSLASCTTGSGSTLTTATFTHAISPKLSPILHRDLKPENVFLNQDHQIKLGDFGLSKELHNDFTKTYVGTPYYMSPELAQGHAYDAKSDIWALGCIAFELCALSPPFDAKTQDELTMKIKKGAVPRLPAGYSEELSVLINGMLNLRPTHRPSTHILLRHPKIKMQLETLDLVDMQRTLAERESSLVERERALAQREQELAELQARLESFAVTGLSQDDLAREQRLAEIQAGLEAREQALAQQEAKMRAHWKEVQEEWNEHGAAAMEALREKHLREKRKEVREVRKSYRGSSSNTGSGEEKDGVKLSVAAPVARRPRSSAISSRGTSRIPSAETGRSGTSPRVARTGARKSASGPSAADYGIRSAGLRVSVRGSAKASSTSGEAPMDRPRSDEWIDQDGNSDQEGGEEAEPAFTPTPTESTPFKKRTAAAATIPIAKQEVQEDKLVQARTIASTAVDDSDTRMWSADMDDSTRSPLPTGKSCQLNLPRAKTMMTTATSGRNLAELAARNAAAAPSAALSSPNNSGRGPLLDRRVSHGNSSTEAMSCDSIEQPSLPSPFIKKVTRKIPASQKRLSGVLGKENLLPVSTKSSVLTAKEECAPLEESAKGRLDSEGVTVNSPSSYVRIPISARAQLPPTSTRLGLAAPGAPSGRIVGRPRASRVDSDAGPLPLPTRRRSMAPSAA